MNSEHHGPIINSRHHGNMPKPNRKPFFIIIFLFLLAMTGYFVMNKTSEQHIEVVEYLEGYKPAEQEELVLPFDSSQMGEIKEYVEDNIITEEEGTAQFYYERAIKKEKSRDFEGAIADYTQAIKLASKHSSEMFNSLNNRGFLRAKNFKDYNSAMKDFNEIIKIETNKTTPNNTRLEAGYSNRAYVKKMKGDKDGACNDLYEALYLGNEKSIDRIEKQIDKVCY